jgi:hypothetical protein
MRADRAIIHAAFAMARAATERGSPAADPADFCRRLFPQDRVAAALLTRAAVDPASTAEAGWAAELAQQATGAFLASLGAESAAAALIARGIVVSMESLGSAVLPARASAPAPAPFVGAGMPYPVGAATLAAVQLSPRKIGMLMVLTTEAVRRSGALAIFEALLRESAGLGLDAGYFSSEEGDGTTHRGLLYGVDPIPGGGAIEDDLALLAAAVSVGGSGQVVFVASPALAAQAAVRVGHRGIVILPSLALPAGRLIAVDPASIAHGFGAQPEIDAGAGSATLHMDDAATPISSTGGSGEVAAPVRSMFQTNSVAVRATLDIAFSSRRTAAVAFIDGAGASW